VGNTAAFLLSETAFPIAGKLPILTVGSIPSPEEQSASQLLMTESAGIGNKKPEHCSGFLVSALVAPTLNVRTSFYLP
jgi:hypothetical protein